MDAFGDPSIQHWWGQVANILIKFHLSETNGSCQARTWTAYLTDGDTNYYANFPPS